MWMISPQMLLDPFDLQPLYDKRILPCKVSVSITSAEAARSRNQLLARPRAVEARVECHFDPARACANIQQKYHDLAAIDIGKRLYVTLHEGRDMVDPAKHLGWAHDITAVIAWADPATGNFSGAGITIVFSSAASRLEALRWAYSQHNLKEQGVPPHPLWEFLPRHLRGHYAVDRTGRNSPRRVHRPNQWAGSRQRHAHRGSPGPPWGGSFGLGSLLPPRRMGTPRQPP